MLIINDLCCSGAENTRNDLLCFMILVPLTTVQTACFLKVNLGTEEPGRKVWNYNAHLCLGSSKHFVHHGPARKRLGQQVPGNCEKSRSHFHTFFLFSVLVDVKFSQKASHQSPGNVSTDFKIRIIFFVCLFVFSKQGWSCLWFWGECFCILPHCAWQRTLEPKQPFVQNNLQEWKTIFRDKEHIGFWWRPRENRPSYRLWNAWCHHVFAQYLMKE